MPENNETDRELRAADADALARELELELKLKRASWEKERSRGNTWRMLSVLFVLLVFLGALLAFFFFVPGLRTRVDERANPALKSGR